MVDQVSSPDRANVRSIGDQDSLAENAIKQLMRKAEELIQAQQTTTNPTIRPTQSDQRQRINNSTKNSVKKKVTQQAGPLGINGSSVFTLDQNALKQPELAPHEQYMKQENLKTPKDIKDDVYFELYGQVTNKFEGQYDTNEKLQKELLRRVDRFNLNEKLYREEIKLLQRELRVRYGYEKNAEKTNRNIQHKIDDAIGEAVDGHQAHVQAMESEQQKEISRKYRSELARINKFIEERKNNQGDEGSDVKEREAELKNSLELITNIAQRINDENRALRKKNTELRSQYKAQENDRETLVKQLVLQKKDNERYKEEIKEMSDKVAQAEQEEKDQEMDLEKMIDDDIDRRTQLNNQDRKTTAKTYGGVSRKSAASIGINKGNVTQTRFGSNMQHQDGPLVYEPLKKEETDEEKVVRYERVLEKLRKMMDQERKNLKAAKGQYQKEIQQKTELEVLLKQACDKVNQERRQQKKQQQPKVYVNQAPGLGVKKDNKNDNLQVDDDDMNQHERERVIELLLSQERVIQLLYDRTFTMTGVGEGNNGLGVQQDLEAMQMRQKRQNNTAQGQRVNHQQQFNKSEHHYL